MKATTEETEPDVEDAETVKLVAAVEATVVPDLKVL